jgi:hypothetical protein
MITLELNRPFCRLIRWLNKATWKGDDRPNLNGVLIKVPYIWACDGYRIHRVNIKNSPFQFDDGFYTIKGVVNSLVILDDKHKDWFGTYPDIQKVWDDNAKGFSVPVWSNQLQKYNVSYSPTLLSQALSLPSSLYSARMTFVDSGVYISISFDLGNGYDAIAEALVLRTTSSKHGIE